MATFSTNQVKQLYVAKACDGALNELGDIKISKVGAAQDEIMVQHYGQGGVVCSDLINKANIKSITAIKASTMAKKPNAAYVACSKAVAGQQYILNLFVPNYCSLGDENTISFIADYKASSSDAVKNVLANLAVSLVKNMKSQVQQLVKVYAVYQASGSVVDDNAVLVTPSSSPATLASQTISGTATAMAGIYIVGAEQDWKFDRISLTQTNFRVSGNTIIDNGDDLDWITVSYNVTESSAPDLRVAVPNSKDISDLEGFCMKERGDIYGNVGYPYVIDTKYMVDPSRANGYDVITIHYAFVDGGLSNYESEKDLVIVSESNNTYTSGNLAYALIGELNTATGRSDSWV